LPLPLSPTTAVIAGGSASIRNEKSSSATVGGVFANRPPPKTFVTRRASISGAMRPP
jgi:hypothetical protein